MNYIKHAVVFLLLIGTTLNVLHESKCNARDLLENAHQVSPITLDFILVYF